jgi:hypothetical protein
VALLGGAALSQPAVAGELGNLLQRLRLRETANPPPLPGEPRETIPHQQVTISGAAPLLNFTLLVPRAFPPGYGPKGAWVAVTKGYRDRAILFYRKAEPAGRASPDIIIVEHRLQALAGALEYEIKEGTAETVRIGDIDGVYVVGNWAFDPASGRQYYYPATHFVVFERDALKIFIYAPSADVTKEQLVQLAASLEPAA